jgi:hypothetical protein
MKNAQVTAWLLLFFPSMKNAFVSRQPRQPRPRIENRRCRQRTTRGILSLSSNDYGNGESQSVRKIGEVLEGISKQGADNMAKLSLAERTKRALLAEQVENQIFANLDELERLSGIDRGRENENNQEQQDEAEAIISQTRLLRRQYDELVSGKGSSILSAVEAVMVESADGGKDSSLGCGDNINGRYE